MTKTGDLRYVEVLEYNNIRYVEVHVLEYDNIWYVEVLKYNNIRYVEVLKYNIIRYIELLEYNNLRYIELLEYNNLHYIELLEYNISSILLAFAYAEQRWCCIEGASVYGLSLDEACFGIAMTARSTILVHSLNFFPAFPKYAYSYYAEAVIWKKSFEIKYKTGTKPFPWDI